MLLSLDLIHRRLISFNAKRWALSQTGRKTQGLYFSVNWNGEEDHGDEPVVTPVDEALWCLKCIGSLRTLWVKAENEVKTACSSSFYCAWRKWGQTIVTDCFLVQVSSLATLKSWNIVDNYLLQHPQPEKTRATNLIESNPSVCWILEIYMFWSSKFFYFELYIEVLTNILRFDAKRISSMGIVNIVIFK